MKKILVISAGRSDYDRYYPILEKLEKRKNIDLHLFLTKAHQDKKYGKTISFVDKKFKILKKNYQLINFKKNMSESFCSDLNFLVKSVRKIKPNLLIVLGDRFEMLLGPISVIPSNIPIIHFFGGAVTEGAIDEQVRHAITKMSHLHFVATELYKKRLLQMGEESWRVKIVGVHELKVFKNKSKKKLFNLSKDFNFNFEKPYCLVTYHPVTLELNRLKNQLKDLIYCLKKINLNIIFTYPNADPKSEIIIKNFKRSFKSKEKYLFIKNCGIENYASIMKNCEFVIGNSSSGLVEAASLKIPSVNVGTRQNGKLKPANVIDVSYSKTKILGGIKKAQSKKFKKKLKNLKNPYESNASVNKIVDLIAKVKINDKLLRKKFIN